MTAAGAAPARPSGHPVVGLLGATHPGPALAVTVLAGLLSVSAGASPGRTALVVAAVLTGQLSIGWSNDLVDLARDRAVGRRDKPLATGAVPVALARWACGVAVVLTVVLSAACGLIAGAVHLVTVASGWAYNLGLKATVWSWVPYALAFGALPVFVVLAQQGPARPEPWMAGAGALLGVGAHLVNVLPDLADDAATGVRGLPHRLGARWAQVAAVGVLCCATAVIALGAPGIPGQALVPALVLVAVLAGTALVGSGRTPFRAAIGVALVDVLLLVWSR